MLRVLVILLLGFISTGAAHAEGMSDAAYTAVLLELNKVRADQNPSLITGKKQLNARILDKSQRTIGKVEDVVVAPNGKFETIMTRIDTSGFREKVGFDVASYIVEPTPSTFTVSLDKSQLKQGLPKLMAALNTAASEDGPFTISSLQNGSIYKQDGSPIAKVKDVLIDNKSLQIVSLLVTIISGTNRGGTIAVPYEAATAKLEGSRAVLTVTDAQAQVMSTMATKRY